MWEVIIIHKMSHFYVNRRQQVSQVCVKIYGARPPRMTFPRVWVRVAVYNYKDDNGLGARETIRTPPSKTRKEGITNNHRLHCCRTAPWNRKTTLPLIRRSDRAYLNDRPPRGNCSPWAGKKGAGWWAWSRPGPAHAHMPRPKFLNKILTGGLQKKAKNQHRGN